MAVHNSFLFAILVRICLLLRTVRANDQSLPIATFNSDNSSWLVTVPAVWNFTTILDVTGRSQAVDIYNLTAPYPDLQPSVYVNGTYSTYATNALNYAVVAVQNTSTTPYSDEDWTLPVICEWPISGMYSRLNRILYYVTLVFALVVRHHDWLVAGALASATSYSGAAAIQAWV
jgi:hypothetical protein